MIRLIVALTFLTFQPTATSPSIVFVCEHGQIAVSDRATFEGVTGEC